MHLIHQIDTKLTQVLPYYSDIVSFTAGQYKVSYETLSKLYQNTTNKVKKVSKDSIQFKKDFVWIISQTTEDFLGYIESKLQIECPEAIEKDKTKRALNIFNELKNKKLLIYANQFISFNKDLFKKVKIYEERYLIPIYINLKATLIVSKQIFMEAFTQRLGQLKMSYKCHKDTITMFWSGEFKEQKILQSIKQNLGSFKQFTVNFFQKGLEIKISKKDLVENYHHIMNLMSEIMKGVSEKSLEQWTQTKAKTVNLYKTVLDRIKAKQSQIRVQLIREKPAQNTESTSQQENGFKPSKLELQADPAGN